MFADKCLHEIVENHARLTPDRIAVTAPEGRLTYGELDAGAQDVADALRAADVGPGTLVGLACAPGTALIVGMLGILKAGGCYVPIDPAYPDERVAFLLSDSGTKTVVADAQGARRLAGSGVDTVHVGDPLPRPRETDGPRTGRAPTPHDLAYVIYTSGSTGVPKGVLVEHRNVTALFDAAAEFGFVEQDTWTLFHSASFDFSVWEIWGALLHGGRLVVVPRAAMRAPRELLRLLVEEQVTVLSQTPSAFRQLLTDEAGALPSDSRLRLICLGGERLDVGLLSTWLERHEQSGPALVNMYGITETTVHVTRHKLSAVDLRRPDASPIGTPLPGMRISLRDASGAEVPDGTPGEVYVLGTGVARGYLNRPELDTERFTGEGDARAYRSGDLAVRTDDGSLTYLGRIDAQIKVRGYRIEPYEIETALALHPDVAEALVGTEQLADGDSRLVAAVRLADSAREQTGNEAGADLWLRDHAAAHLPAHLRPARYRFVDRLPLTPQGKSDRAAVGAPPSRPAEDTAAADTRRTVTDMVEAALGTGPLPADRDLFDLGATSLLFVRVIAEVNQRFGLSLNGSELKDTASVDNLVTAVVDRVGTVTSESR
ncbi:amino acid adenylation domain-containing protein [Streptomyces canus]|uniref:Amino acid adenylation domain-containing protein n=1 Tax=Streptomyces canus TaxID=58343 RepID=A0AAW8FQL7_9ACTN|nr:amino acid adenylation domain-containing protein [Streptomyces canus]MDQ0758947.1 amino acid adenylation domain-containing protein [Streptomyces canus]MDQ0912437.1 amino acid adenylation domain-containing protein [Streptomyces canus]MDQ1072424.1 amino acid adenylation domain-containing protein [Streptomyces canus]